MEAVDGIDIVTPLSPDNFFVRNHGQSLAFDKFDDDLQAYYAKFKPRFENRVCALNGIIVVLHERKFRRAKYLGIIAYDLCQVYLIDEGRDAKVPLHACRGMTLKFAKAPAFGFRCQLYGFSADYSRQALAYFQESCVENRYRFKLLFRSKDGIFIEGSGWFAQVDLTWEEIVTDSPFQPERRVTKYMTQELIARKFLNVSVQDSNGFTSGHEVQELGDFDDELEHDEEMETEDLEPVKKWKPSVLEQTEDFFKINVKHVDDYGQIYYQNYADGPRSGQFRRYVFVYIFAVSCCKPNALICRYFAAFYDRKDLEKHTKDKWNEGEACVACYSDYHWYRARIVKEWANGKYLIVFVDYGNDYVIEATKLRIAYQFGDEPSLAKRVILNGIMPLDRELPPYKWPEPAVDHLYQLIKDCSIRIRFEEPIQTKLPTKVTMHMRNKSETDRKDVAKKLVKLQLARKGTFDTSAYKKEYDIISHKHLSVSGN